MKRYNVLKVFIFVLMFFFLVESQAFAANKDILVIEGDYDNIQSILNDVGFGDRIELVPDNNSVMNIDFGRYKALFINCDFYGITDRPDQAFLDKVKNFVHSGGMLYVTDDSANFLSNWDVEMQYDIDYDAHNFHTGNWRTTVDDPALKAKFPTDRFDANGNILIRHYQDNGEPINNPGRATVLLRNSVNISDNGAVAGQVQAIDFRPAAGGRVVYTTFHNHPGGVPAEGTDEYIAHQNVITIMGYICGSLGTASEQEVLLTMLGAAPSNVIGSPQGAQFSNLVSDGWRFSVPASISSSQLTFALYANTSASSQSLMEGQAVDTTLPIFTLTAPNGETQSVYGDPRVNPIVIQKQYQSGLWTIQCIANTNVVPADQIVTGLVLDGRFGTQSPSLVSDPDPVTDVPMTSVTIVSNGVYDNVLHLTHEKTPSGVNGTFSYVWESNNPSIASVNGNGADATVTDGAGGVGFVTITLTVTQTLPSGVVVVKSDIHEVEVTGSGYTEEESGGGCNAAGHLLVVLLALPLFLKRKHK